MTFATLALCVLAQAPPPVSQPIESSLEVAPTATRHAGIYHVATGTWTRVPGATAAIGPDVVYSNTAPSGYFTSAGVAGGFAAGSENFDEGSIPGTTNPGPFAGTPDRDTYSINSVQIGYCDFGAPGSGGFQIRFFNEYDPCTFRDDPDRQIVVTGLPAGGGCWTIDIDLSGAEFCLMADGNGTWTNGADVEHFGWSFKYAGSDGAPGNNAGFLLAGNPDVTDPGFAAGGPMTGSNTYYGSGNCPGVGTGYETRDFWRIEDPVHSYNSGCRFFGGYRNNQNLCSGPTNPLASYHLELAADTGPCGIPFDVYCFSQPNSTGQVTGLEVIGSPFAADDDVTLRAFDLHQNTFGFFIVSETPGFVAHPGGSVGNLCLGGEIGRFVGPGQIMNSGSQGVISMSTQSGVWSLSSIPLPMGTRVSIAGTTDHFQLWHRSVLVDPANFNFSNGVAVTWQ